jgi:hypothetical protein
MKPTRTNKRETKERKSEENEIQNDLHMMLLYDSVVQPGFNKLHLPHAMYSAALMFHAIDSLMLLSLFKHAVG